MDELHRYIREFVVRTDTLHQRRITQLLNFKQRPGEPFSQTLCRLEETEKDVDIENYTVPDMRAHLRISACIDGKLKEELLKLGQPTNSGDIPEPITSEAIWHAARNYEQRQKCLTSETGCELCITGTQKLCNMHGKNLLEPKYWKILDTLPEAQQQGKRLQ